VRALIKTYRLMACSGLVNVALVGKEGSIGSVHWLALVPTDIRNADDELYSKVRYLIQDEGEHNSYFMESILL